MKEDIEIILDWQQRGMNARILGFDAHECPQRTELERQNDPMKAIKSEAWRFGWAIENASRARL